MNTGDLLSEADWQFMLNPPDANQNAWNYGTQLIDEFFAPNAPFWVETNNIGELITSDVQSQFNGQAGSGNDTGGGSRSVMQQTGNGIDFLPTRSSSEVLDAVVSTNQQGSSPASPGPALTSPLVVVSDTELPAAERAEISKMSSSIFGGEHDSDVAMEDSPLPPFIRAATPLVVGREGALTLPYGTDGTAGRTPHSAQQPLPHSPTNFSNAPAQTLRATPNMAATAALHSSSPYYRGRHTQSTDGAESLRRDMEQQLNVLPDTTAAIPFVGLKTQDTTSPAQETANEEESPVTLAKMPKKKRAYTRKPKLTTAATTSSAPETAETDESNITLAKATKKRANTRKSGPTTETTASSAQETAEANEPASTPAKVVKTRKPKAAIENQMFAVLTTSDNGTQVEKLAKGSELGFTSPAPKAVKAPKRKAEADGGVPRRKPDFKYACSGREVRLLTGKVVEKEDPKKRKTRSTIKKDGEKEAGPNAGKAVQQRRQEKK